MMAAQMPYRARAFAYFHFIECAIRFFLEHGFAAVVGNIDPCRFELHQRIKVIV
jgi:hypothetical protein